MKKEKDSAPSNQKKSKQGKKQEENIVLTFPHIGPYSYLVKEAMESEETPNFKVMLPPPTTIKTIQIGSQLTEAEMCLPYKITLGNLIEAFETMGANRATMFDSCGTCRLKIYNILHQKTLERHGYDVSFFPARFKNLPGDLKKINPRWSTWQIIKIIVRGLKAIWNYDKKEYQKYAHLKDSGQPQVGFLGEIFTILDHRANMEILDKFRQQGAWVHNAVTLSEFALSKLLESKLVRTLTGLKRIDIDYKLLEECEKESYHYFPRHEIGGHGRKSVIFALYFAKKKYDLIVHLYPFPCMPEVTVAKFLDHISQDYNIPLVHLMFDANFGEANLETRIEANVSMIKLRKKILDLEAKNKNINVVETFLDLAQNNLKNNYYLGVDIGSISTKAVIINRKMEVIDSVYLETASDPINAIKKCLDFLRQKVKEKNIEIKGAGATGSGRKLAGPLIGADTITDEITCQTLGCLQQEPKARTILEIGGQDSKYIEIDEMGVPIFFNMNNICSAGTGSFFSGTSRRLNIPIEKFGEIALGCSEEVMIAGRCGVFAESDLITKQQAGVSKDALIKGLCLSMPKNYLANVAKSRKCVEPIIFTGGVATNKGVVLGFERALKTKIKVVKNNKITGCIGAAMVAMTKIEHDTLKTKFLGFEVADFDYQQKLFQCSDCANNCEISLIIKDNQEIKGVFGSRCGKRESLVNKKFSPQFFKSENWHHNL